MKTALEEGSSTIDATWVGHMDACLGCMACVTACPSGVHYDELIESARATIEDEYQRPWRDRLFRSMIFRMFPGQRRLRAAALLGWLYQRLGLAALLRRSGLRDRLPARLQALESIMPDVPVRAVVRRTPRLTPAQGERRRRVGFLTGCVQEVFFGDVNDATVRVLAAEGCEVVAPPGQGCCGALELHGGREASALDRARAVVDVFASLDVDAIVVNAAGCGSSLKDYGRLLADDPAYAERAAVVAGKIRDVTEVLAELEPRPDYGRLDVAVAYHDACHLAHAQGIRAEPRTVLSRIPGLEVRPVLDDGMCCGSAGIYNLVEPEAAGELGRRKAAALTATGAEMVVTTNPGCALQIGRELGRERPVVHPVQLLAAALPGGDHRRILAVGSRPKSADDHPDGGQNASSITDERVRGRGGQS
jgi:glycolate oxidase iron-sulfur subunit